MSAQYRHNDNLQQHARYVADTHSVSPPAPAPPLPLPTTGHSTPTTPTTKSSRRKDSKSSNTPPPLKRHLVLLSRLNKLMKPSDTASWVRSQPTVFQGKGARSPLSPGSSEAAVDHFRIVHTPDTTPLYSPPTPINPRTEHECEEALSEMFEQAKETSKMASRASGAHSRSSMVLDDISSIHTVDSSRDDGESDSTVTMRATAKDEQGQKDNECLDHAAALHDKPRRLLVPPPPSSKPPLTTKVSVLPFRYAQPRTRVKSSSNKPAVSHLETIPGSPVKTSPTAQFEQGTSRGRDPMTPSTARIHTTVSHSTAQHSGGERVTHLQAPRPLSERALLSINTRPRIKHEGSMQNRLSPLWSSSSSSAGTRTHQSRPSVSSSTEVLPRLKKTPSRLQVNADKLLRDSSSSSSSRPASTSDTIADTPSIESDEASIRKVILASATFGHARRSKEKKWGPAKEHASLTPSTTRLVAGSQLYETSAEPCVECDMQNQPDVGVGDHTCVDAETPNASPQKKIVITPTNPMRSLGQSKTELSPQSPSSVYTTPSSRAGSSTMTPETPHRWSAASTPTHRGRKAMVRSFDGEHAWYDSMQSKRSHSPLSPRLYSSSSSQSGLSEHDPERVGMFLSPPPLKLPTVTPTAHEPREPLKSHLKRNVMREVSQGTARLESRRYGNIILRHRTDDDGENADTMKMLASESEGEREMWEKKTKQETGRNFADRFKYDAENEVPQGISSKAKAPAGPNIYEQILSIYDMYTDDLEA